MKTILLMLAALTLAALLNGCASAESSTPSSSSRSLLRSPDSSGAEIHGSVSVGAGASF